MGRFVRHEPCPKCGSKDNLARYEDESAYCFGCAHHEKGDGSVLSDHAGSETADDTKRPGVEFQYEDLPKRGISAETCRRFRYGVGSKADGTPVQVADYGDGVQKYRGEGKQFSWANRPRGSFPLFGKHAWRSGGKRVVVTEGELDALSYAEATGCSWPVVSLCDGTGSAVRCVAENLEWLAGFDEIILMFDMDDAGQKAAVQCAEMLPVGKVKIAKLPRKDANEVLTELGPQELYKAPFNAEVWRPDGIRHGIELLDQVLAPPPVGLEYPWEFLNEVLHGQRVGEMVTWVAGTGSGKTQVLREIIRNLWVQHGQQVGIIALEESNVDSALGQISLEVGRPLHLPSVRKLVSDDEIKRAAEKVLPGFVLYDHWGSVEGDVLLPKIRYMAVSLGIKYIVIDHISIMVSGMAAEGDERKRIDQLVTRLRSLCSELGVCLHIVSHLRKADGTPHEEGGQISLQDIRGSGAPAQLSNFVIGLERNQQAEGDKRDVTNVRVLKNRLTGQTGVVGALRYNRETGRLKPTAVVVHDGSDF